MASLRTGLWQGWVLSALVAGCFKDPGAGASSGEDEGSASGEASSGSTTAGTTAATTESGEASEGSAAETSGDGTAATASEASSASGGAEATGDTGTGPECAADLRCVAAVPPNWQGPLWVKSGLLEGPECPPLAEEAFRAGVEPSGAAATCECACRPLDTCSATLHQYAESGCDASQDPALAEIGPGVCTPLAPESTSVLLAGHEAVGARCDGMGVVQELPEVGFTSHVTGCLVGDPASCEDGGTCIPAVLPPLDRVCIWFDGVRQCPPEQWTQQLVAFAWVDDRRGCGPCDCMGPSGVECEGSYTLHSSAACDSMDPAKTDTGVCASLQAGGQAGGGAVSYEPRALGTCEPAGQSQPMGTVVPEQPLTLCCLP